MNLRKKLVMAGSIAMSLTVGGVAYAFWTTNSTGTGTAKTGSAPVVNITQTNTVQNLVPGAPAAPIDLFLNNLGPAHAQITKVQVVVDVFASRAIDPLKPDCTEADFDVRDATLASSDIAPGGLPIVGGGASGATIALKNTALNQDNCQGVSLNLTFKPVSS